MLAIALDDSNLFVKKNQVRYGIPPACTTPSLCEPVLSYGFLITQLDENRFQDASCVAYHYKLDSSFCPTICSQNYFQPTLHLHHQVYRPQTTSGNRRLPYSPKVSIYKHICIVHIICANIFKISPCSRLPIVCPVRQIRFSVICNRAHSSDPSAVE